MKITILGSGNMARGIGSRAVAGGHDVELVARDPDKARALAEELGGNATSSEQVSGDLVVLALPYKAVEETLVKHGEAIAGKIVVDITNPADWSTMDGVVTPSGSSAAEEIAGRIPDGTPVVKAFNTTFAGTLQAGEVSGEKLDVLIAGDDERAKDTVTALIESGGLRAIDVGPLKRARQLEQVGLFHMQIQDQLGSGYGSMVKLHW